MAREKFEEGVRSFHALPSTKNSEKPTYREGTLGLGSCRPFPPHSGLLSPPCPPLPTSLRPFQTQNLLQLLTLDQPPGQGLLTQGTPARRGQTPTRGQPRLPGPKFESCLCIPRVALPEPQFPPPK